MEADLAEVLFPHFFNLLILEREEKRNIDLLFHLFTNLLFDSCMCSDGGGGGLNPQPWCVGITCCPTERPGWDPVAALNAGSLGLVFWGRGVHGWDVWEESREF